MSFVVDKLTYAGNLNSLATIKAFVPALYGVPAVLTNWWPPGNVWRANTSTPAERRWSRK